jgi:uncharacterized membrane-anchored protein
LAAGKTSRVPTGNWSPGALNCRAQPVANGCRLAMLVSLIRNFRDLLYGSTPAEFKSAFDLDESVARLQRHTMRFAFAALSESAATGPVSASRVRLQRSIPMIGNSFKPFFFGSFENRHGSVYLVGRFTMHRFAKVFMTVWFGALLLMGISAATASIATDQNIAPFVLAVLAMFAAGIGFIAFAKWLARNDIAWLSAVIERALSKELAAQRSDGAAEKAANRQAGTPIVLRVVPGALLLLGVMSIASAISGISSWRAGRGPMLITRFDSSTLCIGAGVYGVAMLVLAFGIYRRRRWGWLAGLVLIGSAVPLTFVQAFAFPAPEGMPAAVRVFFLVATIVVAVYWGTWWYAQRKHFVSMR